MDLEEDDAGLNSYQLNVLRVSFKEQSDLII